MPRISCWPQPSESNPYQRLFYLALAERGYNFAGEFHVNDAWLRQNIGSTDILHFHWPEETWRCRGRSRLARLRGVIGLHRFLQIAKRNHLRIAWTVHNLQHHEGSDFIDHLGCRVLARQCDLLICHSNAAAVELRDRYPFSHLVVMRHGAYTGGYGKPRPRDVVLEELGLSSRQPVVAVLGLMRSYKGIEFAAEAARHLGGDVQFIFAGAPCSGFDPSFLCSLASEVPTVRVMARALASEEFSDIISTADIVLLPYVKITGSGMLLAAWAAQKGVVASDLPFFREMSEGEPDAITFLPTVEGRAIADAIIAYLRTEAESRASAARRLAARYSWHHCVQPVAEALDQITAVMHGERASE